MAQVHWTDWHRNLAALCQLCWLTWRSVHLAQAHCSHFTMALHLAGNQLVAHLRKALAVIGVDVAKYSGHSFRIGAASTATRAGFSDSFIQALGRWKSLAITTYIRTPVEDLVAASAVLTNPPCGQCCTYMQFRLLASLLVHFVLYDIIIFISR